MEVTILDLNDHAPQVSVMPINGVTEDGEYHFRDKKSSSTQLGRDFSSRLETFLSQLFANHAQVAARFSSKFHCHKNF